MNYNLRSRQFVQGRQESVRFPVSALPTCTSSIGMSNYLGNYNMYSSGGSNTSFYESSGPSSSSHQNPNIQTSQNPYAFHSTREISHSSVNTQISMNQNRHISTTEGEITRNSVNVNTSISMNQNRHISTTEGEITHNLVNVPSSVNTAISMNQNRQDSTAQWVIAQNVIDIHSSVEAPYSVEASRNPFLDHIHLAPTQSISDGALYTRKQKSSEDENQLILRLKEENNACKDENQSLRYSSLYVTNSDRDQRN